MNPEARKMAMVAVDVRQSVGDVGAESDSRGHKQTAAVGIEKLVEI